MTREEREELIKHLKYNRSIGADYLITDKDADEIIKALEQEPILDKIRAEIIENSIEDYKYHGCGGNELIIETSEVLEIIDKYKAESEDKDIQLESDLLQKQTTNNCDNCFNGTTKGGCVIKELMKNKDCKYYMPQESEG